MFKSFSNMYRIERSKSKSSTSRLQCWNNFVHMIADECKPSVLGVFLNHYTTNKQNIQQSTINNKEMGDPKDSDE